jgi:hypothetical protein
MRRHVMLLCCAVALSGANTASAQGERHVCRLLKGEEIKALLGPAVVLANVTEDEPERSTCQYEDKDGSPVFILTVYWKGGKNQWNGSAAALKMGDQALASSEGVGIDSLAKAGVVMAGPVKGLGDAAYFSDLLPSLVAPSSALIDQLALPDRDPQLERRGEALSGRQLDVLAHGFLPSLRTPSHRV